MHKLCIIPSTLIKEYSTIYTGYAAGKWEIVRGKLSYNGMTLGQYIDFGTDNHNLLGWEKLGSQDLKPQLPQDPNPRILLDL